MYGIEVTDSQTLIVFFTLGVKDDENHVDVHKSFQSSHTGFFEFAHHFI